MTEPAPIYRDPMPGVRQRYRELYEAREAELVGLDPTFRKIYGKRIARIAAGRAAFVGMVVVFVVAVAAGLVFGLPLAPRAPAVAVVAFGVWLAVPIVWLAARWIGHRHFDAVLMAAITPRSDLYTEVDRLSSVSVREQAARIVDAVERPAVAWWLAGITMITPLFLHFAVFTLAAVSVPEAGEFGGWIVLSAMFVGHCHLFAAYHGFRFAREVETTPTENLSDLHARGWRALSIAIASSLIPGVAFFGAPCVIVAVTGLVFLPSSYWDVNNVVIRERAALADAL